MSSHRFGRHVRLAIASFETWLPETSSLSRVLRDPILVKPLSVTSHSAESMRSEPIFSRISQCQFFSSFVHSSLASFFHDWVTTELPRPRKSASVFLRSVDFQGWPANSLHNSQTTYVKMCESEFDQGVQLPKWNPCTVHLKQPELLCTSQLAQVKLWKIEPFQS